ncbi:MAG: nucleoside kinase, partial [Oscillospiraceae bacterium]|nr:nucleoside kinase [Oscillospiraceae bacterium]
MTKPISVILEGQEVPCPPGASVQDLVAQHMPQRRADALAVRVDDCAIKGLRWQPQQTCRCALLDYRDEEARRMYERSARFVLLLAARAVLPGVRVRFEHSAGYGLYISLSGHVFSRRCLLRLARRMRQIVAEDMPFVRTRWSREQAMTYFEEDGQPDKVRLLGYRSYDYFDVYTCGGMCEYFYGEMLPSTGYVRSFALHRCAPGLVLSLPAPSRPDRPAPFHENPKLLRTFAQSAHWAGILGCHNAADVNDLIVKGEWRQFIRVNEALHERAIADMADHIVNRGARVLFIAGPSSSGKTTFANRLGIELRVYGAQPVAISLDDYYLSRDQVPLGPDGTPDLECLESLDVPLFNEHLRRLLHGEEVELPRFSFALGRREDGGRRMALQPGQPVIIEGIHGLNEALTGDVPGDVKYR